MNIFVLFQKLPNSQYLSPCELWFTPPFNYKHAMLFVIKLMKISLWWESLNLTAIKTTICLKYLKFQPLCFTFFISLQTVDLSYFFSAQFRACWRISTVVCDPIEEEKHLLFCWLEYNNKDILTKKKKEYVSINRWLNLNFLIAWQRFIDFVKHWLSKK